MNKENKDKKKHKENEEWTTDVPFLTAKENKEIDELMTPLLTVKQVAKILNISEYTVRNYFKESKIRGLKLKRMWRMTLEELNQWVVKAQLRAIDEMKEKERRRKEKGGK